MTTLLTNSGIDVRPGQVDPAAVHIEDIAHALSLRCRFLGHTRIHYSVAQHCLLVARILDGMDAPRDAILCGLMHDAHEAYVGNVPTSIKILLGTAWSDVELQAEAAVLTATGLTHSMMDWRDLIRHVDRIALATERRDLMRFDAGSNRPWVLAGIEPHPTPPRKADGHRIGGKTSFSNGSRDSAACRFTPCTPRCSGRHARA
ncbi:hypothetical protein [Thiomonas intermedia]|uniref:hypothetical protein n=1 Tax=Thiomonas intermedia TaxID=926 RepID=UPI0009A4954F|nr:hypothetical protein [Thiomonas intermedia]